MTSVGLLTIARTRSGGAIASGARACAISSERTTGVQVEMARNDGSSYRYSHGRCMSAGAPSSSSVIRRPFPRPRDAPSDSR